MKSLLSTLSASFIFLSAFSQPIFNSTDFAIAEDSFLVSVDPEIALKGMDFDTSSAGMTWNFDSLNALTQTYEKHMDPANTGYRPAFCLPVCQNEWNPITNAVKIRDSLNLVVTKLYNMYDFYANTGSTYEQRKIGYTTMVLGYPLTGTIDFDNQPDVIYNFPIQYTDVDSSESEWSIGFPGMFNYSHWQKRRNEVDGYGTLSTPFGTFSNVIRMKSVIYSLDTLTIDITGDIIPIPVDSMVEYHWMESGTGIPLLKVKGIIVEGFTIYSSAEYVDSLRCLNPVPLFAYAPLPTFLDVNTDSVAVNFNNLSLNADSVRWNFDDPTSASNTSNAFNPVHTYTSQGLYMTELIACNRSSQCVSTICDTINLPVVVVDTSLVYSLFTANPLNPCVGDTVRFTNLSINDTASLWVFDDPSMAPNDTSTMDSPTYVYNSAGSYDVMLIAMNDLNVDTFIITINASDPPIAAFTWSDSITDANIEVVSTTAGGGASTSYYWTVAGANPTPRLGVGDTLNVSFAREDSAKICLLAYNSLSCASYFCETIFITECLNPKFTTGSASNNFCIDDQLTLTNQTTSGLPDNINYSWFIDQSMYSSAQDTVASIPVRGAHEVMLVADNGRCSDTLTKTVRIKDYATLTSAGMDTVICLGDSFQLAPVFDTGDQNAYTLNWSPSGDLSQANIADPWFYAGSSGELVFKIQFTFATCDGISNLRDTVYIGVMDSLTNNTLSGNSAVCDGQTALLTATGGGTYLWSTSETTSSISVLPAVPTKYYVTITDSLGCFSVNDSVEVTLNSSPVVSITGTSDICDGDSTALTASGGATYFWSIFQAGATVMVGPTNTTTYYVTATDASGCEGSDSIQVNVDYTPIASFASSLNQFDLSVVNSSTGGTSCLWEFESGITVADCADQAYTYGANGTYTVMLTVTNNCGSDVFQEVVVVDVIGINQANPLDEVRIIPNPVKDKMVLTGLQFQSAKVEMNIRSLSGAVVQSEVFPALHTNDQVIIDLKNGISSGFYILEIISEGESKILEFVVVD